MPEQSDTYFTATGRGRYRPEWNFNLPFLDTAHAPIPTSVKAPPQASPETVFQAALRVHQEGRITEAASLYEAILKSDPEHFGALYHLALIRVQQSDFSGAASLLLRALEHDSSSPDMHCLLADILCCLDSTISAIEHYERAITLNPSFIRAHNNIANILQKRGDYEKAIFHYKKALELEPGSAEVHNNLGTVFEALGRAEDALTEYRLALAQKPDLTAIHKNIGKVLTQLGHIDEGTSAFQRALIDRPNEVHLLRCLSEVKQFQPDDKYLNVMETMASDVSELSENDQIELHFALGKALLDAGRLESAFHHLLLGNSVKRAQIPYDENQALELFSRTRNSYAPGSMRGQHGFGYPTTAPILILGMPRSGTTLVEQILASHPSVFGAGEIDDFQKCGTEILGPTGIHANPPPLTSERLYRWGESYALHLKSRAPNALRVTDKTNRNFLLVGLIHLALPNARIIHIRRNPVDTCFSCFSRLFNEAQYFTYDLQELGRYYRAYDELMAHWRTVLPESAILEVRYEDLVQDFDTQARRLIDYCGLEWDDACSNFHKTQRVVRTASAAQVRQPLYQSAIGASKPYRKYLGPLLEALGDLAEAE